MKVGEDLDGDFGGSCAPRADGASPLRQRARHHGLAHRHPLLTQIGWSGVSSATREPRRDECRSGEAANQISDESRKTLPQVPWPKIVAMRQQPRHLRDLPVILRPRIPVLNRPRAPGTGGCFPDGDAGVECKRAVDANRVERGVVGDVQLECEHDSVRVCGDAE